MMVNLQVSCLGLPSFVILAVTLQLINFLAVLQGRGTDTLNANCPGQHKGFRWKEKWVFVPVVVGVFSFPGTQGWVWG